MKGSAAREHLQQDSVLSLLLEEVEISLPSVQPQHLYENLIRSVLSQQLSGKAAATIHTRFLDLFEERYPHSAVLSQLTDQELRLAGVSRQKAGYLRNIAITFEEEQWGNNNWTIDSDEEIIRKLTTIKGVGRWTAEMILMFTLGRQDVFPLGDVGIQQAIKKYWKLDETGKQLQSRMKETAEPWKPYRTLACTVLWKAYDNGVEIRQD